MSSEFLPFIDEKKFYITGITETCWDMTGILKVMVTTCLGRTERIKWLVEGDGILH